MNKIEKQVFNEDTNSWECDEALTDEEKGKLETVTEHFNLDEYGEIELATAWNNMFLLQIVLVNLPKDVPKVFKKTNIARA